MPKKNDSIRDVIEWANSQLEILVKIPAVGVDSEGEVKTRPTALLTLRMANELKKLLAEDEQKNEVDEITKILKG